MADIKVRDLTDTTNIDLQNQIMVLTNDENNQVQNITVGNLLSNVLSSDNGNVLEQGTDGKLYVETPENITGDLADLDTVNKTSLVNSINEVVSNLSNEATTRLNADNNLQSQIDVITSASDVTDIVGTYAQLQTYDTTGLPDNSIIKVLQDESRQDETTYYRWVITGGVGAWVLIGEEGPYYTKSQADSLFATQQTTGNLASLDTSDKTSLVNAINELSSVLDPTQTADYINNSKAVESGAISSNSIILSDVTKYAHSTFDLSKFTVVGSPAITDDGIASGFSSSNYLRISNTIGTSYNTFALKLKIKSGATASAYDFIFDNANCLALNKNSNRWNIYLGDGNSFNIANSIQGSHTIDINTDYYIKLIFDGTKYVLKYSVDDNTYIDDIEISSSTKMLFPSNLSIGYSFTHAFTGSIDLKQFSITVDGVPVFSGNKTGIDTIKPDDYTVVGSPTITDDGVASGFSSSNKIKFNLNNTTEKNVVFDFTFTTPDLSNMSDLETDVLALRDYNFLIKILKPNKSLDIAYNDGIKLESVLSFPTAIKSNTQYRIVYSRNNYSHSAKLYETDLLVGNLSNTSTVIHPLNGTYSIGSRGTGNFGIFNGSIDLNSFKIYVDGNLVYQPCLKIPYTESKTGSKIVNAIYRDRVNDMAEQFGYANYYTLSDTDFTLPQGELYGMIERLNQLAKDEIGLPKATLSNTLNDNEIWLEGAEVSKLTYSKLYAIYGDDYGTPTDSANFVLPDCRDRVMQGIGSGGTFGYIEAGLPNITGKQNEVRRDGDPNNNGALHSSHTRTGISSGTGGGQAADIYFDASWSNSIYGNSTTVQPPAIKVRFKTRFQ